jgi:hypothetical protein
MEAFDKANAEEPNTEIIEKNTSGNYFIHSV